jgi:hypothetical protein
VVECIQEFLYPRILKFARARAVCYGSRRRDHGRIGFNA